MSENDDPWGEESFIGLFGTKTQNSQDVTHVESEVLNATQSQKLAEIEQNFVQRRLDRRGKGINTKYGDSWVMEDKGFNIDVKITPKKSTPPPAEELPTPKKNESPVGISARKYIENYIDIRVPILTDQGYTRKQMNLNLTDDLMKCVNKQRGFLLTNLHGKNKETIKEIVTEILQERNIPLNPKKKKVTKSSKENQNRTKEETEYLSTLKRNSFNGKKRNRKEDSPCSTDIEEESQKRKKEPEKRKKIVVELSSESDDSSSADSIRSENNMNLPARKVFNHDESQSLLRRSDLYEVAENSVKQEVEDVEKEETMEEEELKITPPSSSRQSPTSSRQSSPTQSPLTSPTQSRLTSPTRSRPPSLTQGRPSSPPKSSSSCNPLFTSTPARKQTYKKQHYATSTPTPSVPEKGETSLHAAMETISQRLKVIEAQNRSLLSTLNPCTLPYIDSEVELIKLNIIAKNNKDKMMQEIKQDIYPQQLLGRVLNPIVCTQISWKDFCDKYKHIALFLVEFYNLKDQMKPVKISPTKEKAATARKQLTKWWSANKKKQLNPEKKQASTPWDD